MLIFVLSCNIETLFVLLICCQEIILKMKFLVFSIGFLFLTFDVCATRSVYHNTNQTVIMDSVNRTVEGKKRIAQAHLKHGRYVSYRARRAQEMYYFSEIKRVVAEAIAAGG